MSYFSPCHAGCTVQVKDKESMQKTNLLSIEKVGTEDEANSTASVNEPSLSRHFCRLSLIHRPNVAYCNHIKRFERFHFHRTRSLRRKYLGHFL